MRSAPYPQLSVAIVGADYPNRRGPARRFAIAVCAPGDPVNLLREPRNQFDEHAIAVFDQNGVQLGYVRSERAAWLAPQIDRGAVITAIFQERTDYGCAIRLAFGREAPVLPPVRETVDLVPDWWPDEEWPD